MPRGELCTSEVQGHSGTAANIERKHGSNACTHQSEMQLEGDFIVRDIFMVHIFYRDCTEVPYSAFFHDYDLLRWGDSGQILQTVLSVGKSSFSNV